MNSKTYFYLSRLGHGAMCRKVELSEKNIMGRGPHTVVSFLSVFVSREHCIIYYDENTFKIIDLGSLNGTYVNDTRLEPQKVYTISIGDIIGFGISYSDYEESVEKHDENYFVYKLCYAAPEAVNEICHEFQHIAVQ